jgi:hypothetical protein
MTCNGTRISYIQMKLGETSFSTQRCGGFTGHCQQLNCHVLQWSGRLFINDLFKDAVSGSDSLASESGINIE